MNRLCCSRVALLERPVLPDHQGHALAAASTALQVEEPQLVGALGDGDVAPQGRLGPDRRHDPGVVVDGRQGPEPEGAHLALEMAGKVGVLERLEDVGRDLPASLVRRRAESGLPDVVEGDDLVEGGLDADRVLGQDGQLPADLVEGPAGQRRSR